MPPGQHPHDPPGPQSPEDPARAEAAEGHCGAGPRDALRLHDRLGSAKYLRATADDRLTAWRAARQGSRLGIRSISRPSGSEEAVYDLVHFSGHVRQTGFLGGARIGEAGDRIGQIAGMFWVAPDPLEAAAKQAVSGVYCAGGTGPSRIVAGLRVVGIVEIIGCDRAARISKSIRQNSGMP
jgi:hypothetical protein